LSSTSAKDKMCLAEGSPQSGRRQLAVKRTVARGKAGGIAEAIPVSDCGYGCRIRIFTPQRAMHPMDRVELAVTAPAPHQVLLTAFAQYGPRPTERGAVLANGGWWLSLEQILETGEHAAMPASGLRFFIDWAR